MKRFSLILYIITFLLTATGCQSVTVTSADELLSHTWYAVSNNNMTARLSFDINNSRAYLNIFTKNREEAGIEGTFAVDTNTLYIISDELLYTFCFDYQVTGDSLMLTYENTELIFNCETASCDEVVN